MKVLIPGVSSAMGRLVARQLVSSGHQVIGIDRRLWPEAHQGVDIHQLDIRKRPAENVFRTYRPDAVIHLATVTHFTTRSADRYRINLGGTRAVFHHCRAYGVKHVVFVGRHTYYGATSDTPLYHREDDPPMVVQSFPDLSDLVAADLYAASMLWRASDMTTSLLRICYTLGSSGHGTLGTFMAPPRIPLVLGFDPLFQFIHEQDAANAICLALDKRIHGVFNVAGPPPLPLSTLIEGIDRTPINMPERLLTMSLGHFGLPRLPRAAINHLKYPVVVDSTSFEKATDFVPRFDEYDTLQAFKDAFPARAPSRYLA
jgi:UDP-glucose 4-epimerase